MLQALQSNDNNTRKEAEIQLQTQATTNPIQLLEYLLQNLQSQADAEFASIILSKTFFENEKNLQQLQASHIQQVINMTTESLKVENKLSFLKRMCDLVVKGLLKLEKYDDMMVILFQIAQTATTQNLKLSTMYYVEIMCEFAFCDDLLVKNSEKLNQIFTHYFQDSDPLVRCATLKSLTSFLVSIDDEAILNRFQGVVPTILQQCLQAIQIDQQSSIVALQSLQELQENHCKFLKNANQELLNLYTELFTANVIPDLRKQALHGLQTLSSTSPAFIRKAEIFKTSTVIGMMKMLTEVDRKDWEQTFDDNCLQLNDISSVAEDCLGKMVKDLSVKFLLPLFVPHIMQALQSPNVNEQHAGLIAMATLSESASEHFDNELPHIINLILPLSNSANKLIIYDLLSCLAFLCQEFTPRIQNEFGIAILNLIVQCMKQNISKKVQYISIACLVDFSRDLVEDKETAKKILAPSSQFIIEQLSIVISENLNEKPNQQQVSILEQALSAFSVMAVCLKEQFTQYYDQLMPYMMKNVSIENTTIRALLVECMGSFLVSISGSRTDQCRQDSDALVRAFIQQQQTLDADDSYHAAIFFFYTQVASALKYDFGVYLEQIFPLVERALRMDVGFAINQEVEGKNIAKVKLDLKFLGLKNISLNTSALEQKIEGAHTLLNLAEHCGKAFYPYIAKSVILIKEMIGYKHSSEIQKSMSKLTQYLLLACQNSNEMAQVFNELSQTLIAELNLFISQKHFQRAAIISEDIADAVILIRHPLIKTDELFNICLKSMQLIKSQKESIAYEDETQFEQECEFIDELMGNITNISTELITVHKCEAVQQLMPIYYSFFTSKSTKNQVINAIAFFNLVLPVASEQVFQQAQSEIIKYYTQLSKSADLEMKQNLLFGFGNFAKRMPTQLEIDSILEMANSIINNPECKKSDQVASYETALTTLGKIGMYCNIPQSEPLLNRFLESLPHQYQDAQETHLMLLKEIQGQNQMLVNRKEQIISVLNKIRTQDQSNPENELLCDEGRQLIQQLLC